jgi:carbamoyl-phosphate synthase large subunit
MEDIHTTTGFDPWFIRQIADMMTIHDRILTKGLTLDRLDEKDFLKLKQYGFGDAYIARLIGSTGTDVRARRKSFGISANFYRVDTCAAEFEAFTPTSIPRMKRMMRHMPPAQPKVIVLGADLTALGRGSNLIIVACMLVTRSKRWAMNPSW